MTAAPAPDVTDRTDATDEEFAARIAGYPADVAHAAMVEQVARAIFAADDFPGPSWEDDVEGNREDYRCLAAAAIAAMPANPAVEAVKRVEALAAELESEEAVFGYLVADRLHAAIEQSCGCRSSYIHDYGCTKFTAAAPAAALAPQPADAEGTGR